MGGHTPTIDPPCPHQSLFVVEERQLLLLEGKSLGKQIREKRTGEFMHLLAEPYMQPKPIAIGPQPP